MRDEAQIEGTRFRLFPQAPFLEPGRPPETVWVASPAGTVRPGPSDDRMYVIDPIGKDFPYGPQMERNGSPFLALPPWTGDIFPPAWPDAEGHFDHIPTRSPEFEAAHIFGSVRRTLDVWETYFGRPIPWHFEDDIDRLEITLLRHLDNALFGYGFMEIGSHITERGAYPFALNFDVLAHEVGHGIIYAEIGVPREPAAEGEYFGFQESAADTVALIALLHFDTVVNELLENTRGNLYALNKLNRIGELSRNEQMRLASNSTTMIDFTSGWTDEHNLSLPLTGAIFDILVDIFHEELLDRGLIVPDVEDIADLLEYRPDFADILQAVFDAAFADQRDGFGAALRDARDTLGLYLARAWTGLPSEFLRYDDVGRELLAADAEIMGGRYRRIILNNFDARGIGKVRVGPRLGHARGESHSHSARTIVPRAMPAGPKLTYAERWRRAQPHLG